MKTVSLIVDFGLVILIWMTQLIVYPSFRYYEEAQLLQWHHKYTGAITVIVMPLMLAQVALHGYLLYSNFNWASMIGVILIALIWVNTFTMAVPLHNQIASNNDPLMAAEKLVSINWYRTIAWTLVFLIAFFSAYKTILK